MSASEACSPSDVSGSTGGQRLNKAHEGSGNKDADDDLSVPKSKRQRVHFSCSECHRRKQKCDRRTPCNHCIARKIPERCKTFQPGEEPGDIIGRLTRLESTIYGKLDLISSVLQQQQLRKPGSSADHYPDLKHLEAHHSPYEAHRATARRSPHTDPVTIERESEDPVEGSEAGDEVMLHNGEPTGDGSSYGPGNFTSRVKTLISDVADHKASRMADPIVLTAPMRQFEQAQQLDAIMHDFGATFSISKVLLAALPAPNLCHALIDHFFENNWLRQPLSRRHFMEGYESFWKEGPLLTVNNLNVYALYLLTASIGVLTYRGPLQTSDDPRAIRLMAKRLFFSARQSLLISSMLGREDMEQVIALHLASRFLFIDRRISEAWSCVASAVKTAHSIGLHRDGSLLGLPEKVCAARRRIWSITYFTERILCMNLGRPTAIDDGVVDIKMVNDLDVEGDFAEYTTPPLGVELPPGEVPRFLTFTLMRQRLASIIGKVISIYQNINTPAHYSDVVAIDHSLETLRNSLPTHLKSEFDANGRVRHLNEAWDDIFPYVPVHRYLQQAEILFVRMSLHRPYLIQGSARKGSVNVSANQHHHVHRYNFSRRSCIEAAYQTLILRKDLSDRIKSRMAEGDAPPSWVAHLGTYNTLSAIVILGIYLLMEPNADNAALLLKPLRMFYDLYRKKRQRASDEIKEREFTILHMFLERIDEARQETGKRKRADVPYAQRPEQGGLRKSMEGSERQFQAQSKEHDTAGALLELNSVHSQSELGLPASKGNTSSQDRALVLDHTGDADDGSLPWPYLPLRTPHHATAPLSKIPTGVLMSGSPATNFASSEASQVTPPVGPQHTRDGKNSLLDSDGAVSSSDVQNGASVHQLFDSWFRSNAFENADVDILEAGQSTQGFKEMIGTFPGSLGGPLSGIGGPYMGFGQPTTETQPPAILRSEHDDIASNSVQWSTVPVPSHPSERNGGLDGRGSLNQSGISSGDSGLDLPKLPPHEAHSVAPHQHQAFETTYDPAFWQSLIDKISQ